MNAKISQLRDLIPRFSSLRSRLSRQSPATILFSLGGVCLLAAAFYAGYVVLNSWLSRQDRYLTADGMAALSARAETLTSAGAEPVVVSAPAAPAVPSAPVQIRIPSINVKRSIIEVPVTQDPKTGGSTRDVEMLLKAGRQDLVGHWGGSAYPGQAGNTILVGHNYGYGRNGVFLRLGKLQLGQKVEVVTEAGQTFTYEVTGVERVKWQKKDTDELLQHGRFLSLDGPERLTLVTCGGSNAAPFPERIYITAERVSP